MPKPKIDHQQLQKEGLWIAGEFYPFSILWRKLRQTREEQNQNLQETADKLGITPSALSRLERSNKTPTSDILGRIISYIFGETSVTFGKQNTTPNQTPTKDTLTHLRHTLNQDSKLNPEQKTRLTQIYTLLYQEFTQTQ